MRLNLPVIIEFRDYHEIKYFCDTLNQITSHPVKCKELSTDSNFYMGLYYQKKLPNKKKITSLIKAMNH